jgi:hypothetical protein
MKVDLEGYQKQKEEEGEHFYRDANSLAFGSTGFRESLSPVFPACSFCGSRLRRHEEMGQESSRSGIIESSRSGIIGPRGSIVSPLPAIIIRALTRELKLHIILYIFLFLTCCNFLFTYDTFTRRAIAGEG